LNKLLPLCTVLLLCLTGCESQTMTIHKDDAEFAPPPVDTQTTSLGKDGGLYQNDYSWSLVADRHPYRVGDILTIVLDESTQSSKQAKTDFDKNSDATIAPATFGTHTYNGVKGTTSAKRNFSGEGTTEQQNSLHGYITVSVHHVMANGVLEIKGEKWLTLNQGDEYIRLTGLVRVDDISNDNSISSQRIANARISYAGRGALSDANSAGWLTRLFNHPLFPV
jgi:flagellar L-ring protein precursor FlgH